MRSENNKTLIIDYTIINMEEQYMAQVKKPESTKGLIIVKMKRNDSWDNHITFRWLWSVSGCSIFLQLENVELYQKENNILVKSETKQIMGQ